MLFETGTSFASFRAVCWPCCSCCRCSGGCSRRTVPPRCSIATKASCSGKDCGPEIRRSTAAQCMAKAAQRSLQHSPQHCRQQQLDQLFQPSRLPRSHPQPGLQSQRALLARWTLTTARSVLSVLGTQARRPGAAPTTTWVARHCSPRCQQSRLLQRTHTIALRVSRAGRQHGPLPRRRGAAVCTAGVARLREVDAQHLASPSTATPAWRIGKQDGPLPRRLGAARTKARAALATPVVVRKSFS